MKERHHRTIIKLSSVFAATYRQPDHAWANIWKLLTASGPTVFGSLFTRKKPSSFGALQGWSFLFFSSPKRKKAMTNAYALPDTMMDWLKTERRVEELNGKAQEVRAELSQSMTRAQSLYAAVQSQPPIQLDPDRDRDIRVQLFQERNAVLARIAPRDIASSDLPEERKAALLNIAARYREQRGQERGGR